MPFSTDFVPPMRTPRSRASRYLLTLGVVGFATALRFAAEPFLHDEMPFFMYVGAVVVATWLAGGEAGLFAAGLSALAGNYFFGAPRFDFGIRLEDVAEMGVFVAFAVFLVGFAARWRRAEHELRGLHAKASAQADELQALLDAVPAAVFVTRDTGATRMEGNRFASEYLRVAPGANLSKTAPPDQTPASFQALKDGVEIPGEDLPLQRAVIHGVEVRDYEFDLAYPDGTTRALFGNALPLRDSAGRVRGAVGAFVDVSAQKRVTENIRESEARFRSVLDGSRDVIYRLNIQTGQYDYIGPAAETVLGYSSLELMEMGTEGAQALIHPDDMATVEAAIGSVDDAGSTEVEYRQRTKTGTYRWMSNHMWLVRNGEGRPLYRDGNVRDVTRQKELENALQKTVGELEARVKQLAESESRYRTMGETLPYGVWRCDATGRAIYTSQSFLDLLGMSMEEMQQFGWTQRLVPDDVQPMLAKWFHCIGTGELWDHEHRIVDRNGEVRTVLTRGLPVRNAEGAITSWVGVNLDITDRKGMETRLRDQAGALELANRLKDEFLATLSHELRTPLNAIVGWSDMLRRGALTGDTLSRAIDSIYRNAKAQNDIISDVLDVSRIVSGKMALQMQNLDPGAVLAEAVESVRPTADARGISLATEFAPIPFPVSGDPTRLQQVFWNLLVNAIKFTAPGGTVRVSLRAGHEQVEIEVADTGIGIGSDFLPHVFERFRQSDSSITRRHGGLGLGLAIVRHLVELHGGKVAAESPGEGGGATFTVTLPARTAERRHAGGANGRRLPAAEDVIADLPDLCGIRVMVVDDEADAREMVASVLSHRGAIVEAAGAGAEALQRIEAFAPDALLLDLAMPDLDGFTLLGLIRDAEGRAGRRPGVPAIALTALARAEDRERALASGFQQHLAKPVETHTLVRAVAEACRARSTSPLQAGPPLR